MAGRNKQTAEVYLREIERELRKPTGIPIDFRIACRKVLQPPIETIFNEPLFPGLFDGGKK